MKNKLKYKLSLFVILAISIICLKNTDVFAKSIVNNTIEYELHEETGNATLLNGKNAQGNIEIPNEIVSGSTKYKVNSIADESFRGSGIEGIIIPSSVELIGKKAFYECKNLLAVGLSEGIIKIDDYAFYSSSIMDIKIPNGVTYLGINSFSNCDNLKSAIIPGSVPSISSNAFSWCTNLESVKIDDGVKEIQDMSFYHCTSLKSIDIPDSVNLTLGDSAFEWCTSLKTVNLSENFTAIGNRSFSKCDNLRSIIIPSGVRYIGEYAFNNCEILEYIELPESITYVGNGAFGNSGNGEGTKIKEIICVKNSFVDNEGYFYKWDQYGVTYPMFSYKVSKTSVSGSIFGEYTFTAYISVGILLIVIGLVIIVLFRGKKSWGSRGK